MAYNINTFLKPSSDDKLIQLFDSNGVVRHSINPFTVKNTFVRGNIIHISLNSDREILIDFRNQVESRQSILLLESQLEVLRNRNPNYINRIIEEYIQPTISNATYSLPDDPTITTSTTGVMMGLSRVITPVRSGSLLILISGDVDNNTNSNGSLLQIRYGTGTPPTNGDALTGTTLGGLVRFFQDNADVVAPFSLSGIANVTPNVQVWVDISLSSITGGSSRVRDISVSIVEL